MNLLDQHFPKSNKLHAVFNRNTVKVRYSCTQNMSSMIKSRNKKVINKDIKELKSCNCSLKSKCPLTCQCQVTDIYINALYYHQTNQIKCISELLRVISKSHFIIIGSRLTAKVVQTIPHFQNIFPNLNLTLVGSIAKKVPTYSNISKKCLLCLHEKLETILDQRNYSEDLN